MRLFSVSSALIGAAAVGLLGSLAHAGTVPAITFDDGNPLYVQSVVGSGSSTTYLVIDLPSGPDPAWQYNYNGTVNGYQMLTDIAAADPNLLISATYYSSFAEHYVNNFQYGAVLGNRNQWDVYTGSYSSSNVSSTDTQGTTWASSSAGIDNINLTNGGFIGWVDVYPKPPLPVLPETQAPVPEPASLSLVAMTSGLLIRRRRR